MKHFLLLIFSLFIGQTMGAQEARTIDWQKDLDTLAKELPEKHYNFFTLLSPEDFLQGIDAIKAESKNLSDVQVAIKTQQLIAGFGDSHTRLDLAAVIDRTRLLPLSLMCFDNKYYVLGTAPQYEKILGSRLTAINHIPLPTVIDSLSTLMTLDNSASLKAQIPYILPFASILEAFGFIKDTTVVAFFETPDQKELVIEMKPDAGDFSKMVAYQPDSLSFCYKNANVLFTDLYLPDDEAYYILYNKCWNRELEEANGNKEKAAALPSFKELEERAFTLLHTKPVRKIVFDVRFNGGGNSYPATKFAEKLADFLQTHPQIKTYVVLGRYTFSSGILNALDFKRLTNAVFVGEETAGKPNHFGEIRSFRLPESGIDVIYSTNFFKNTDEDINTLVPDIPVETTFSDYSRGIDPVYERIKRQ